MGKKKEKPAKKNLGGRPPKSLDLVKIREMSRFMYTEDELAIGLGMAYSTYKVHKAKNPAAVDQAIAEGHSMGRRSLRAKQMNVAMKGNVPMLKFLGVNYLNQKEKIQHSGDLANPVAVVATTLNFGSPEEAAAAFDQKLRESQ